MVTAYYKECCSNCSNFNKKLVPPVNSEVLVHLNNIENPEHTSYIRTYILRDRRMDRGKTKCPLTFPRRGIQNNTTHINSKHTEEGIIRPSLEQRVILI